LRAATVRTLGEQLRGEGGQPLLPRGVVDTPRTEGQGYRHDRLLVVLYYHAPQAVVERRLLERWQATRRGGGGLRGRRGEGLGGQRDGRTGGQKEADHRDHRPTVRQSGRPPGHCVPPPAAGFTTITTAFAGSRYFAATRRTSSAVTARKRSKSLLISVSDAWNIS